MIEKIRGLLSVTYFQNTLFEYVLFVGAILLGVIIVRLFRRMILKRLKSWSEKTSTSVDNFLVKTVEKTAIPVAYYGIFFVSTRSLRLNDFIQRVIHVAGILVFSIIAIRLIMSLIDYSLNNYRIRENRIAMPRGVLSLVKGVIWIFGVIFILDNLGFKISTVIAGLGIGGVAVAMASQTILKDLFNYFVILFDRPFEIGDFIEFDDCMGVVEHIGVKSTKLRSTGGEQLIISNSDLTDSKIRNYKRMERRTVIFNLGISPELSEDKLKMVPEIISGIVNSIEDTEFVRAHFKSYSDFSLNFEVLYYVNTTDYIRFMDIQQEINLSIKREFEQAGVDMPYPTQKIMLDNRI